jgi:hypothetical protein
VEKGMLYLRNSPFWMLWWSWLALGIE